MHFCFYEYSFIFYPRKKKEGTFTWKNRRGPRKINILRYIFLSTLKKCYNRVIILCISSWCLGEKKDNLATIFAKVYNDSHRVYFSPFFGQQKIFFTLESHAYSFDMMIFLFEYFWIFSVNCSVRNWKIQSIEFFEYFRLKSINQSINRLRYSISKAFLNIFRVRNRTLTHSTMLIIIFILLSFLFFKKIFFRKLNSNFIILICGFTAPFL